MNCYFENHAAPFVFFGLNWNVGAYGCLYENTTGMIEVVP